MKGTKINLRFVYFNVLLRKVTLYSILEKKGFSNGNIYNLIANKNIEVNDEIVTSKWHSLRRFINIISITLNDEISTLPLDKRPIKVIYEDDYILIVNKEANEDIEPTKSNYSNNLANRINYYFQQNDIKSKVHFVNRLDKVTSGLVIVAKNQYIHNLFSKVKIIKKYKAIVDGKTPKKGLIKVKIKKDENLIKRVVCDDGKLCLTKYKLISFSDNKSLVDIRLYTGRAHQIRVSFAFINHPLSDDHLYNQNYLENSFYLNAYYLKFKHPILKKKIIIKV